jgi:hypothetical protein
MALELLCEACINMGIYRRYGNALVSIDRQEQQITCDKSIEHDIRTAG